MIADATILTAGLIIGGVFYRNFEEGVQKRIRAVTVILLGCCLAYTFIRQKAFLTESPLSIVTVIIGAAWKTALFEAGLVIITGIVAFVYRKVKNID